MKNLRTYLLCAFMAMYSFYSHAQVQKIRINEPDYNKPRLFQGLPEIIPFNPDIFFGLLNKQPGSVISTSLSTDSQVPFEGRIASSSTAPDGRIQQIAIRSTNFAGATFSLSKVQTDDGIVKYNGILMSFQHGDLYVLQQAEGHFILVKKNYYDLVNE